MSFLNKNKGGYIGYFRYSTPEIASGVWNLRQQQQESSSYEWIGQYIYKQNGLTGWTNSGASQNNSFGVPLASPEPSIVVSAVGQYAYTLPTLPTTDSLIYTTIVFWVWMPANNALAFHFAHSNTGQGPFLKLDTRTGFNTGLMYGTSWGVYGGEPISGIRIPSSNWTKIAIRIPSTVNASWYVDGVYRDVEVILKNGNNIGIRKFAGTDACYVSYLRVYRGPV